MYDQILIEAVKNSLRITYDYLDDDIRRLIEEAKAVIDETCGNSDYTTNGLEVKLLIAYCRYSWNKVPQLFESDYQADLLKLQIKNMRGLRYG